MQVDINKIVGGNTMFETFKSGNIGKQLELLSYYTSRLNCKKYKTKTIQDFIPNIQQTTNMKGSVYIIQLDNILYQYYNSDYSSILGKMSIQVAGIEIYINSFMDGSVWIHKTPKTMLDKIKEHSKIFKQYNRNLKDYLKYNSDYIIEQKKLNKIFNESK